MTLKLKTIFVAALLASGGAIAAPSMQSCAPMEILHSGNAGLSYSMNCSVGDWKLKYVGSVPAGTDPVTIQYTVAAQNADGSRFSQVRNTRILSPAHLGQALLREAVVLDDGALALRDCKEAECSIYRPLDAQSKMTKATITVTPQIQALEAEKQKLNEDLSSKKAELAEKQGRVVILEAEVQATKKALDEAKAQLEQARQKHEADIAAMKSQFDADMAGLSAADKAEREKLAQQSKQNLQSAKATVSTLNSQSGKLQADLQKALADRDTAIAVKHELERTVIEKDAKIDELTKGLELVARLYKEATDTAFELINKYDALSREKAGLEETINGLHNELNLANTKVEAAHLARDLSLQAADVANLDADTLHKANLQLSAMLTERDETIFKLKKALAPGAQAEIPVCSGQESTAITQAAPEKVAEATDAKKVAKDQPEAKKAQKLQAQLDAALPELYALRHLREKAEKELAATKAELDALKLAKKAK